MNQVGGKRGGARAALGSGEVQPAVPPEDFALAWTILAIDHTEHRATDCLWRRRVSCMQAFADGIRQNKEGAQAGAPQGSDAPKEGDPVCRVVWTLCKLCGVVNVGLCQVQG